MNSENQTSPQWPILHTVDDLSELDCPHCGSDDTEHTGEFHDDGAVWTCNACRMNFEVHSRQATVEYVVWTDGDGNEHLAESTESRQVQSAGELYDKLEVLAGIARRINDRQHAGLEVLPQDWALLHQMTNAAQGLLSRIQKGE